ncbi:MAG: glycosyltransferase family 4 protein [Clostridia bacterium]|nr:glycosyltransferase family 4 protein [Clostridia bacterium]
MKVLYIADELTQSGAIKSFEEVVVTMKEQFDIDIVVCTSGRSELNDRLEKKGIQTIVSCYASALQNSPITWWKIPIKYVLCGIKYYLKRGSAIKMIEKQIDFTTIDLIHTNVTRTDIGVELAAKYKIPNIMHIREFGDADFKCWSYRKNYMQFLNNNVTKFIAISEAVKNSWVSRGLSEQKVEVIYNGVNSELIKRTDPEKLSTFDTMKMVIVGGIIPNKGQMQAVQAISLLPEQIRKKVTLDIIGWSSKQYIDILTAEIEKLGLKNQVNLLGAKDDVYDRLQNYHVGLMCSKAEGFGRVTAEYMHAGLGVIASNCGANPELVQDGVTGLLYDKNNTSSLSEKIVYYYNHRDILSLCAYNGQQFATEHFTKKINANNIFDVYKNIINK